MEHPDLAQHATGYRHLPGRRSRLVNQLVPKFVKLFFMVVLHTPLIHPLLSGRWASLEFTGRRTGRIYRTPIAYARDGESVYITTDSPWWKNLRGGARVRLLIRLHAYVGHAYPVTEPAEAARRLRQILDAVPTLAYPGDVRIVGGAVSDQELDRVISAGRKVIEIRLEPRS
jgi:deazaflavin-dependent oxidoreductase (nitroreductase family)